MHDRPVFGLFAALLVVGSAFAGPVAAAAGGRPSERATGGAVAGSSAAAGDAWRITNDVTVYRNGTARVVLTTNGSAESIQLTKRNVHELQFHEGSEAVTEEDRRVVWDPSVADRVVYTVRLGEARRYGSAVLDSAIIFRTSEILSAKYWRGSGNGDLPAPERRLTLRGPDGWTEAAPGEKVGSDTYELRPSTQQETFLREMVAVGDFEVKTWSAGDDTIRYVAFPGTDAPPERDLKELLTATMPEVEALTGADPEYPLLAMTVPESIENGGVARHHSFIVQGGSPTFSVENGRSTYVHELVHTYQRNWGADGGDWISEGMASYYQHLALREAGLVTPEQFRRMVRVDTTDGYDSVGDPVRSSAGAAKYAKGEAVYAALDVAIRADTNGEKTIGDVVARFNEQTEDSEKRLYVTRSEFLAAVEAVTGKSYADFYDTYVSSSAYPDVLLSEEYSLSDPPTVEQELPPASVLAARNDRLRERLATRNATVQSLRDRLAAKNETIAALREKLDEREATVRALRGTIEKRNGTVAALRARLSAKNETIGELRSKLAASSTDAGTPVDEATPTASNGESVASERSGESGDLRATGAVLGLGLVFAVGVAIGRRQ